MKWLPLFTLLIFAGSTKAQEADTLIVQDTFKHSPVKATFFSLFVPGLGQAYNKKYWKVPLVYAIIGTPLYFALDQSQKFDDYKSAYAKRVDGDPNTVDNQFSNIERDETLLDFMDFHRKNRDLFFVLTGVAYALNVVDAAVDAHLYYFDISDDLSAKFRPSVQYSPWQKSYVPSLNLTLKIGKKSPDLY